MMKITRTIVFFVLLAIGLVIAQNPQPLLPAKFSEAFYLRDPTDGTDVTNGKTWLEFDSEDLIDNWRIDWITDYCSQVYPDAKLCRFISSKTLGKSYFFAPLQGLCMVYDGQAYFKRDLYNFMKYKGIKQLENEHYYSWYSDGFFYVEYLADTSQSLKPRRFVISSDETEQDGGSLEAIINSYSDKFNSTSVFQIPKYCQNQTTIQNNFESLKKFKFMQKLLPLINQAKKTKQNLLKSE